MTPITLSREGLGLLVHQHTANVCQTMLGVDVAVAPGASPVSTRTDGVVVAFVGLTGAWNGTGSVSCSGELARRLSGRMLLTEFPVVDAEVLDAMGEIANMIIGNVKEDVARDLGALAISTPTVIHGESLQTRSVEGETDARVAFHCEGDLLEIRVSLVPARAGA